MKAADLYIRVSTEEQKLTGFSQRYQEEILRKFCEINLLEIGEVVREDYSARTFNRPQWSKLFSQYKSHKLKTPRLLLVTRWDRFSRNTADAYFMLNKLSKLGIEVQAIEQPLDLSIPENKMMMAFFLTIPEVENTRRSLEIKKGIRKGTSEGRWLGLAPYGYKNKVKENGEKYIELVPAEASYMRHAFIEISKDIYSLAETYRNLVSTGYPRSFNSFLKAIRNPIYCGKVSIKDETKDAPLIIEGLHEGIITEELFFKVQNLITKKKFSSRETESSYHLPLRGILICPKCRKILTGSGSKSKTSNIYFYYHCQTKCGTRFPANTIHQQFISLLTNLEFTEFSKYILQQVINDLLKEKINQELSRSGRIMKKIEACEQRPQVIRSLLLVGSIEPDEYRIFTEECAAQLEILKAALLNSKTELSRIKSIENEIYKNVSILSNFYKLIDTKKKLEFTKWLFPHGVDLLTEPFSREKVNRQLHPLFSIEDKCENNNNVGLDSNNKQPTDRLTLTIIANCKTSITQAKHIIKFLEFLVHSAFA